MANELFGKQSKAQTDEAKREREGKKIVIGEQKVRVIPNSPIWKWLAIALSILFFGSLFLLFMSSGSYRLLSRTSVIPLFETIKGMLNPFSGICRTACWTTGPLLMLVYIVGLKPPMFDRWVRDLAKKRLSCSYIFFKGKYLFIHYDVSLSRNDVMDFVREISDKSEHFTYYLDNIDIDSYTVSINIAKKQAIPKRCSIDKSSDTSWNIIPLGEAVNNERKTVSPIGWKINNQTERKEMVNTLVSTHLIVAGGTGSGKSVVENGIIGHISRFADRIQGLLCDVKRVEFGGLERVKGVHKVALTVTDVEELLGQAQSIMMDRFKFMEQADVQDIYDLEKDVEWFKIGDQSFQFDEIMQCEINGQPMLLTMGKIYEAVQEGKIVDIPDWALLQ
jgi:hypothetical protein